MKLLREYETQNKRLRMRIEIVRFLEGGRGLRRKKLKFWSGQLFKLIKKELRLYDFLEEK